MTRIPFRLLAIALFAGTIVLDPTRGIAQNSRYRSAGSTQQFAATDSNRNRDEPAPPRAPFPPLAEEHQAYIDRLLEIWEESSRQIDRYKSEFTAWEFDPVFLRPNPETGKVPAKTIAEGTIRFSAPDKGAYEVTRVFRWSPPEEPGGKAKYLPDGEHALEKWICDGQSVFIFDYPRKRLLERPLPPEIRGKHITDGPLPFLFGIEAEKLKQRYWIRVITPQGTENEYWLEIWPKRREDAANYKKLEVILSRNPFLPKAIQIFPVNFDAKTRPISTVYEFRDQKINFFDPRILKFFVPAFDRPTTPSGWQYEKLDWGNTEVETQPAPPTNSFKNARRPSGEIRFPR